MSNEYDYDYEQSVM